MQYFYIFREIFHLLSRPISIQCTFLERRRIVGRFSEARYAIGRVNGRFVMRLK